MCACVYVCLFTRSAKWLSAVSAVFISEATGETLGNRPVLSPSLALALSALKIDIEHGGGEGEESLMLVAISSRRICNSVIHHIRDRSPFVCFPAFLTSYLFTHVISNLAHTGGGFFFQLLSYNSQ